jgi:hypothetical protein
MIFLSFMIVFLSGWNQYLADEGESGHLLATVCLPPPACSMSIDASSYTGTTPSRMTGEAIHWFAPADTCLISPRRAQVQPEGEIELALLAYDHSTIPAGYRTDARGVILNFEVEDARKEYERLVGQGRVEELMPLRDEEFGQGNLIDVI